jgi:hypothetical protein
MSMRLDDRYMSIPLSSLVPTMLAIIPLSLIARGVFIYGEQASLPKLGLWVAVCALVGVVSAIN